MSEQAFISLFTPGLSQPEDLEAILVQRHEILDDTVERVRESATTGNKHHLLFVGPRGTGKTHLVTLLVHRLGQDADLDNNLRIAWLNEDETSTTLRDFLQRIYLALHKRYPDEYSKESLDPMYDLEQEAAARQYLIHLLLDKLQQCTLLVVVENLDALFESLKKAGQQDLRAFIQENPVLSIIATAQKLTDDIKKRKSAFFGFFQTDYLNALSVDEATELLGKIAILNKQPDIATFLKSVTGRARIRALYHLSRGNHRIYIALSKLITHDSINTLVDLFSRMIDKMTPYYQERIRWLSPQQRKIVEYLCTSERPCTVKKISRYLFLTQQSISGQLKDLRDKGYVLSTQRGRESLYEISEPLMRICVEAKENQVNAPLRILVDFLRIWYDKQEIFDRLKGCNSVGLEYLYLASANEKNLTYGNLRAQLLVENFSTDLNDEQWRRLKNYSCESEGLALAYGNWERGDSEQAILDLQSIIEKNRDTDNPVKLSAWALLGEIYYQEEAFKLAIDCLNSALELPGLTVFQATQVYFNRGLTYERLEDLEEAITDYSAIVDMENSPVDQVIKALEYRSVIYEKTGDLEKSINDYSSIIDMMDASDDLFRKALLNRSFLYEQQGDYEKAISGLNDYISLPDISLERVNQVRFNMGAIHGKHKYYEKAIVEYTYILKQSVKDINITMKALFSRGMAYALSGDLDKAITDLYNFINLDNVSPEKLVDAYILRGSLQAKAGNIEKALVDFETVNNLKVVTREQAATAYISQGVIYWKQNKAEKSEQMFKKTLQLVEDISIELRLNVYFNLAVIYISGGRWSLAMQMFDAGLKESSNSDNQLNDSVAVIEAFFESNLTPKIRLERIIALVQIYLDNNVISLLGEALIRHLGDVFTSEDELPATVLKHRDYL